MDICYKGELGKKEGLVTKKGVCLVVEMHG